MKKYYGIVVFMGFTLALIVILKQLPEPKQPTEGIPHNYWVPTNKETIDWSGTTQGEDTTYSDWDMYMDCGDDDYYDPIPRYSRFTDVPASTDTIIIVDEILYKMNNKKTTWAPIYPDEYRMWIGNNGDTIWE